MTAPMGPNSTKRAARVILAPLHPLRHASPRQHYKETRMTLFHCKQFGLIGAVACLLALPFYSGCSNSSDDDQNNPTEDKRDDESIAVSWYT